jgi:glucosamine--fructose-6-phosphate aminotransferase (isomerizing)
MRDLLRQIDSLPDLVREDFARIDASVGACLADFDAHSVRHLYITGCGDSYFAGLGTKLAISTWSGLRVSVGSSLPAGRYDLPLEADHSPENLLVLGVSRSGMVSRTIEAVRIANQIGANTAAVTATPDSKLAQEADGVIDGSVVDYPGAPNLRSYHVSLLALYALGLHFGVIRGCITQAQADHQREEIIKAADVMEATIAVNKPKVAALAEALKDEAVFHFLGHGPNTSSAMFSAAKIVECVGRYAVSQDTEEWAHYEYFNTVKPNMPTFLISPGYRTHQLTAEFTAQMKRIGRTSIAVTPQDDQAVAPLAVHHLPVVGEVSEILSPLVYCLAGNLFGAYLLGATDGVPFRRDRADYTTSVDHRVTEVLNLSDLEPQED